MTRRHQWTGTGVEETALDIGGTFTFARGASPEQIMTAFGMNPAKALLVPASTSPRPSTTPTRLRTYPPEHPWIRVGVAGEWGFALDESSRVTAATRTLPQPHWQRALTWCCSRTPRPSTTSATALAAPDDLVRTDGRMGAVRDRADRFVEQMRQVGLPTTIGDDRAVNPMIALLQMLTVALGIWVPRDLALGPLLTVQRETALPLPPGRRRRPSQCGPSGSGPTCNGCLAAASPPTQSPPKLRTGCHRS